MIKKSIINAVIKQAKVEDKDRVLLMFIERLSENDYDDSKVNNMLELMLEGVSKLKNICDFNIDIIKENISTYIFNCENYNIKNVKIKSIDNIECNIITEYEYIDKINEERDDVSYSTGIAYISFDSYNRMLKKS